jgi:hypothetical protein
MSQTRQHSIDYPNHSGKSHGKNPDNKVKYYVHIRGKLESIQ